MFIKALFHLVFSRKAKSEPYCASYMHFLSKCMSVRGECGKIGPLFGRNSDEVFRAYMSAVWQKRTDGEWFSKHSDDFDKAWFIASFLEENDILKMQGMPEPVYHAVRPAEGNVKGYIQINAERSGITEDTGCVKIKYSPMTREFSLLAKEAGFSFEGGMFIKNVDRKEAPLTDRAAEAGVFFLGNGYGVQGNSSALIKKIEKEDFAPLPRYRMYAGKENEILIVCFPRDRELFSHFVRNGGRWTGKELEFPVFAFDAVSDIVNICGFHIDDEAQKRIEAWRKAEKAATLYRAKHRKTDNDKRTVNELFEAFLTRKREKLTDLYEPDTD